MAHRLAAVVVDAAHGRFPVADGTVEVVPPYVRGIEAVVAMTGHTVVATDLDHAALTAAGADAHGGASGPSVLQLLAGRDGVVDSVDVLLVAPGTGRSPLRERRDLDDRPEVRLAALWRSDVQVHGDERGLVTVARGLGGLPQLSFEVFPDRRGRHLASALLVDALGLIPEGDPVVVAVAPGNAASLRATLAAGFVPVGSVVLVRPGRTVPEPVTPARSRPRAPAAARPAGAARR